MDCSRSGNYTSACPFIQDRIDVGTVSYKEAIHAAFHPNALSLLQPRIDTLIQQFPGSLWKDECHQNRMEVMNYDLGYVYRRNTREYYAAMYLLTSNQPLFRRTYNCFCYKRIEFSYAALQGITAHNYTLFQAARRFCDDGKKINILDLMNPDTVDDESFRLIINAFLIVCFGLSALKLSKGEIDIGK